MNVGTRRCDPAYNAADAGVRIALMRHAGHGSTVSSQRAQSAHNSASQAANLMTVWWVRSNDWLGGTRMTSLQIPVNESGCH